MLQIDIPESSKKCRKAIIKNFLFGLFWMLSQNIFLSNLEQALNTEFLKTNKITHILTIGPEITKSTTRTHLIIPLLDLESTNILIHLEKCINFISNSITTPNNNILIHCVAGVSRSSTVLIAYVMKTSCFSVMDSFQVVKGKFPWIDPNPGFMRQLNLFEDMKWTIDVNNSLYKRYFNTFNSKNSFAVTNTLSIKCKKCRRSIANLDNIIKHDKKDQDCTSVFIDVMDWMTTTSNQDKLSCPFCLSKLGSYNWSGDTCSCGCWVTPSFRLSISKLDLK